MTSRFMTLILAVFALNTALVAHAEIVTNAVEYKIMGKSFEGFVAYDDAKKGPRPGILLTHDWLGLTAKTTKLAQRYAELGYTVFAVDVYGKGIRPNGPAEAGPIAMGYKKDRILLRARMQGGLQELKKMPGVDPTRIAVVGYCFGGTAALELARAGAEVKDVVTFHGGLDSPKPEDGKKIKAKVLVLHGADDPTMSAADVAAFQDEMRKANVDWQMISYGGAVHSFTDKTAGTDNSKGAAYNERADKRSWEAMTEFLKDL